MAPGSTHAHFAVKKCQKCQKKIIIYCVAHSLAHSLARSLAHSLARSLSMIRLILHELRHGSKHVALVRIGEALAALEKGPPREWPADEDVVALRAEAPTAPIKSKHRANIVSVASLATLLSLRLRCVKNDQCWYEEDRAWRRDGTLFATHVIFKKELWEQTPLQFFEEHPRYAYTASMVLAKHVLPP